ncbi:MAG: single-stranded DNA-binding protein [Chloroflexota bacterium]|nr:single-stranded DNA-binding protein [Chloroflexota bacterium]
MNKVLLIGRVGRTPEMRYMPSGRAVTSFSVGTTHSWQDPEGGEHEKTEWFNVVAWGDLAERCKSSLRENHRVYVEGRLQMRSWEAEEGNTCFRSELVADDMILLSSSSGSNDVSGKGPGE